MLYSASVAGGVVVTILALGAVAGLVFWWVKMGGCYKVVSQEQREARRAEMEEEMGEKPREEAPTEAAEAAVWASQTRRWED